MTVHKLTAPGSRKTVCNLNVPGFLAGDKTATTWEDGDQEIGQAGLCAEGCWHGDPVRSGRITVGPQPVSVPVVVPAPSAPRAKPDFTKYDAMAYKPAVPDQPRDRDQVKIGDGVTNRDGSIVVHLSSMPADGRVFLVPRKAG